MLSPSHRANNEDASTVQVTDANSLLGAHLVEGDWVEALEHLETSEGTNDVNANNNPLGLFQGNSRAYQDIPRSKTSALFAALFVRAPLDVVAKIYEIAPQQFEHDDLAYTLSIIPSEEEERLMSNPRQRIPYRSRAWAVDEYHQILHLLLQHSLDNPGYSSTSPFVNKCASWILPFPLTPLSIAAYNPDVSEDVLQTIIRLEPRAIDIECKLFGVASLPFIIAAASPIPPKPPISASVPAPNNYNDAKERRWRKVKLLIVRDDGAITRESSVDEICAACEEAKKRNEWELVREFLKRQSENPLPVVQAQIDGMKVQGDGMDVDIKLSPVAVALAEPVGQVHANTHISSESLEKFRAALAEHDKKNHIRIQKQQKARAKDDWVHKNMGVVMYPIDAVVDVATHMIPRSWLKRRHGSDSDSSHGIVSPMS